MPTIRLEFSNLYFDFCETCTAHTLWACEMKNVGMTCDWPVKMRWVFVLQLVQPFLSYFLICCAEHALVCFDKFHFNTGFYYGICRGIRLIYFCLNLYIKTSVLCEPLTLCDIAYVIYDISNNIYRNHLNYTRLWRDDLFIMWCTVRNELHTLFRCFINDLSLSFMT